MKTNKKIMWGFLVVGIMIVLAGFVNAVGVACGYSPDSPLRMYPGEERIVRLNLQNTDVEGDASVEGRLLEGMEIASLEETSFIVPYESRDVDAKLKVLVPEEASVGQTYTIRYEFGHIAGEVAGDTEGNAVVFSQGVKRSFNVEVIEKPAEPAPVEPAPVAAQPKEGIGFGWAVLIVVVIAVIIVVIYALKKKKSSKLTK